MIDGSRATHIEHRLIDGFSADCIVVGAGTVGCTLAYQMLKLGHRVMLIEAGGLHASKDASFVDHLVQTARMYKGATEGRAFGVGGTSSLWGGQMLEMTEYDFYERSNGQIPAWPIQHSELLPFYRSVASWLGISPGKSNNVGFKPIFSRGHWVERFSSWIGHARRNVGNRLIKEFERNANILLITNTAVSGLTHADLSLPPTISGAKIKLRDSEVAIKAPFTVICCGALETTRLLLRQFDLPEFVNFKSPVLGKYFADHLSVRFARLTFEPCDRKRINFSVMSRFDRGVMRTPRFELAPHAQKGLGVSNTYAHFLMVSAPGSGFDLIRKILRRMQGIREPLQLGFKALWRGCADVAGVVFWRYVHKRLYLSPSSELYLQIDVEQIAGRESYLRLAEDGKLEINWKVSERDLSAAETVGELFLSDLANSELGPLLKVTKEFDRSKDGDNNIYDVYHPTGCLRMGDSPHNSVVDRDLKVWNLDGLYVNSTAVFPSAGAANPGMTHFALTFRLAEHLAAQLQHVNHSPLG